MFLVSTYLGIFRCFSPLSSSLFYSVLIYIVYNELSAVILIFAAIYITCIFVFWFLLIFSVFTGLGQFYYAVLFFFLMFLVLGVCWVSQICLCDYFIYWIFANWKILDIIFSNISLFLFSLLVLTILFRADCVKLFHISLMSFSLLLFF